MEFIVSFFESLKQQIENSPKPHTKQVIQAIQYLPLFELKPDLLEKTSFRTGGLQSTDDLNGIYFLMESISKQYNKEQNDSAKKMHMQLNLNWLHPDIGIDKSQSLESKLSSTIAFFSEWGNKQYDATSKLDVDYLHGIQIFLHFIKDNAKEVSQTPLSIDFSTKLEHLLQDVNSKMLQAHKATSHSESKKGPSQSKTQSNDFYSLLNSAYAKSVEKPDSNRFKKLKIKLDEHTTNFETLKTQLEDRHEVDEKLSSLDRLEYAVKNQQTDYLINILNSIKHFKDYNVLYNQLSVEDKTAWDQQYQQLQNPSAASKVGSYAAYAFAKPISWFKSYAPQRLQDFVADYSPATADSQARETILRLITKHQDVLSEKSKTLNTEMSSNITPMVDYINDQLGAETISLAKAKQTIEMGSLQDIDDIITRNHHASELAGNFDDIIVNYQIGTQQISMIKSLNKNIDDFIHEYDGIMVSISNFFAQFLSIFKSTTATQIDKLKALKSDLQDMNEKYESLQNEYGLKINSSDIDPNLKDACSDILEKCHRTKTASNDVSADIHDKNRFFSQIEQTFEDKVIKPKTETEVNEEPSRTPKP